MSIWATTKYTTIEVYHPASNEKTAAACAEAGAPVHIEPVEIRPGVRIAMVGDPDGNWVEFIENA